MKAKDLTAGQRVRLAAFEDQPEQDATIEGIQDGNMITVRVDNVEEDDDDDGLRELDAEQVLHIISQTLTLRALKAASKTYFKNWKQEDPTLHEEVLPNGMRIEITAHIDTSDTAYDWIELNGYEGKHRTFMQAAEKGEEEKIFNHYQKFFV